MKRQLSKPKLGIAVTGLAASRIESNKAKLVLKKLEKYFDISYVPDLISRDIFDSQPVDMRIQSLCKAFMSSDIVMAYNGGYNSVELLFEFNNIPDFKDKIFVGYSDNTVIANALVTKSKSRAWLGPNLATIVKNQDLIDVWAANIMAWYFKGYTQIGKAYNELGIDVLQPGVMEGKVIGGNAYSFDLLQGTEFVPRFDEPFIYILEGEDFITDKTRVWQDTIRNLDSVMLQKGALDNLRGLLIGRFPDSYRLNINELQDSVNKRSYLRSMPIAYNVPRGYWQPSLCLPLGELMRLELTEDNNITFGGL